jgi:hypothetical protein
VRKITLAKLRALARLYADERPEGGQAFINTDEVDQLLNYAIAELYELLIDAGGHEHYEVVNAALATAAGVSTVSLPSDFLRLLSLQLVWGPRQMEAVAALEHVDDRTDLMNFGVWSRGNDKAFRIRGSATAPEVIEFFPTPTTATPLEVRYIPTAPILVNELDTFNGVDGWEKMVALKVAGELLIIRHESPSAVLELFAVERDRIQMMADKRAVAYPDRIRDVTSSARGRSWRRLGLVPPGTT